MYKLLVSLFLSILSQHALAEDPNTKWSILKKCEETIKLADKKGASNINMLDVGYCMGFMRGLTGAQNIQGILDRDYPGASVGACVPSEVTNGQLAETIVKYLKTNPAKLNEAASTISLDIREIYPCPELKSK